MREVANSGVDLADQERVSISTEYKQIPKQPRYGALGGMYVKKSIYDDVVGGFNMIRTGDESWAERVLGNTGAMGTFSRYWKWAKVSANPPSPRQELYLKPYTYESGRDAFLQNARIILPRYPRHAWRYWLLRHSEGYGADCDHVFQCRVGKDRKGI